MKIGFNMLLWATHVTEEHFKLIEAIKKVGYDGVEIPLFEGDTTHFEKIAKVLDDQGLSRTARNRYLSVLMTAPPPFRFAANVSTATFRPPPDPPELRAPLRGHRQ